MNRPKVLAKPRIVFAIALIVSGLVLGALAIRSPEPLVLALRTQTQLAPGLLIKPSDLTTTGIPASLAASYVPAGQSLAGKQLIRTLGAGELIPISALATEAGELRLVNMVFPEGQVFQRGDEVEVWVTHTPDTLDLPAPPELVLARATVSAASTASETGVGSTVELSVAQSAVGAVIDALRTGVIDLVRIPK